MVERDLEFRGIPLNHLIMYIEELNSIQLTHTFPFVFQGDQWCAQILSEKELAFTSVFKVNAIYIRFCAEHQDLLEEILRKFRLKTTRAGG